MRQYYYMMGAGVSFDADALAFINAAGITDNTQKTAINDLVINLKGNGVINATYDLWSKMIAIYPFIGGTASSHKFNLKNPIDSDAAFRLTYFGTSLSHTANGVTGGGTGSGSYAIPHIIPSSHLLLDDVHICNYLYDFNNATTRYEMGIFEGGGHLYKRTRGLADGVPTVDQGCNSNTIINVKADTRGMILSRKSSSVVDYFNDGVHASITSFSNFLSSLDFTIFALNIGGFITNNTANTHAYDSIGYGLTSLEGATYHNCIENYLSALGR